MPEGYRNAGDVELKTLTLVTNAGLQIDLLKLFREWSVYQDMFSHYLQTDILIFDAAGTLNAIGGITGGELIIISYRTGGPNDKTKYKTHVFGVTEISNRQTVDEKNEIYILSGVSIESYQTIDSKVSRAYGHPQPTLVSQMIDSVTKEFMRKPLEPLYSELSSTLKYKISKTYDIEETKNRQKFVIPNMRIDDTIDYLCRESISDKPVSHFVFWEDAEKFNFKDLNTLVSQEPRYTFSYAPSNYDEGNNNAKEEYTDPLKIINYNVEKESSLFDNIMGGLYKTKTVSIDIQRKKKTETIYDYSKIYEKFNKLQPYSVFGTSKDTAIVELNTTRSGHDSDIFFALENHIPNKTYQNKPKRRSFFKHISNKVLSVSIPGNSEVLAGDVVYLSIPPATNIDGVAKKEDKYLSGKYLVTKVRHKHIEENFTTFLECIKDTGVEGKQPRIQPSQSKVVPRG
jgi:hypothetical protein